MNEKIDDKAILDAVAQLIPDVTTIRDLKGISTAEMEAIYSIGFNFYNTGRLDDAEKVFRFLVLFDHMTPKYWIGLGAVQQVKKEYAKAVSSYGYASFLDLKNPKPQYFAAECFLAMGDGENALSALAALKQYAPENTEEGALYREKAAELEKRIAG